MSLHGLTRLPADFNMFVSATEDMVAMSDINLSIEDYTEEDNWRYVEKALL